MRITARWVVLALLPLATIAIVMWWLRASPAQDPQLADDCRGVVVAGLDTWKAKKLPAGKQAMVSGIQFHDDDWKAGVILLDYSVLATTLENDGFPRCFVRLKLSRAGKTYEREVCYMLNPATNIITRDPYS
jgi:hypothetical protein